ncbi:MAG TPA: hypothetical protein DCY89_09000 [Gammaproteobacteria bacterium]|nr:hypothetical protein [Gammaproteobacteria bacterium]
METLVRRVDARHVRDYLMWLRFGDGLASEVDLSGELDGPVFEPFRGLATFVCRRSFGTTKHVLRPAQVRSCDPAASKTSIQTKCQASCEMLLRTQGIACRKTADASMCLVPFSGRTR